jgi:hypothetical protein
MVGINRARHTIRLKIERTITVLSWLFDRWENDGGYPKAGRTSSSGVELVFLESNSMTSEQ